MGVIISGGGGGSGTLADHTHTATAGDGGATLVPDNLTVKVLTTLGDPGVTSGTLRFEDGSGSGFRQSLSIPAAGLTANRSTLLADIGGQILMVGQTTVAAGGTVSAGNVGTVNITGRTTAITTTTITNGTPAGLYMISTQIACTTVGAGTLSITYTATTDGGSRTITPVNRSMVAAGIDTNTSPIYLSSGNITFVTAFSGGGSGTYAIRIRASFLG